MVFIETSLFTRLLPDRLSDDEYRAFQNYLAECPGAGDIVQGTGGLRKARWAAKGKGKRGGVRIIYYWYVQRHQIYLMTIYAKNEVSDLSARERVALMRMLAEWNHD